MLRLPVLTLATLLASASAGNAQVLDQVFEPNPQNISTGVSPTIHRAQTFTVGMTGILSSVDVRIVRGGTDDLFLDIRSAAGGAPVDSVVLGSVQVPWSSVPTSWGWVTIDLSSLAIPIQTGDALAIVLYTQGSGTGYSWGGQAGDPYPPGAAYNRIGGVWSVQGFDLGFRTWVTLPASVGGCSGIVAQSFEPNPVDDLGIADGNIDRAQTFTIAADGILTNVEILVQRTGNDDLMFDVRSAAVAGPPIEPDNLALAAVTVPAASIPTAQLTWVSIDIRSFNVAVQAGDPLAIVLRTIAPSTYTWGGQLSNPYAVGAQYYRDPTGGVPVFTPAPGSGDLGFRVHLTPTSTTQSSQVVVYHATPEPGNCVRFAAAGVTTRNAGPAPPTTGGTIVLPPGPSVGNVLWAGLYWVILDLQTPIHANAVTLNGTPVLPNLLGVTGGPCHPGLPSAYAYWADVTSIVAPSSNTVAGLDDSGSFLTAPVSEGASLLVVYNASGVDSTSASEIIITHGNDLLFGSQFVDLAMPVTSADSLNANLWFVGGDGQVIGAGGQVAGDNHVWNCVTLGDGDDWDSSDPLATGPPVATATGWDTDSYAVLTGAPNTASVWTAVTNGDCINWLATVLEVDVSSCDVTSVPLYRSPGEGLLLAAPMPNPGHGPGGATFRFTLVRRERVHFKMFDVRGGLVARRDAEWFESGGHSIRWDPGFTSSGVYFVRLTTDSGHAATTRWVLLR